MPPEKIKEKEKETIAQYDVVAPHREMEQPKEGEKRVLWPHSTIDDGADDDTVTDDIVIKKANLETVQAPAPAATPAPAEGEKKQGDAAAKTA